MDESAGGSGDGADDEGRDDEVDGRPGTGAGGGCDGSAVSAVLFDMDGVLVDSEQYWSAFEEEFTLGEAVRERPPREEVTGMNFREMYEFLDGQYGTTVDRETFVARYEERARTLYSEEVSVMDGAAALVADLRATGCPVGIVSSSPHAWIDRVVDRFDLRPLDLVVSAEEVDAPGKPEPHVYGYAADRLGREAAECVVVEDSRNGIRSAVGAGAFTVAYQTAANEDLQLASEADAVVEGPAALRRLLCGLVG
jgi:HAD superfamily hydrolase (TIGR01509 family)